MARDRDRASVICRGFLFLMRVMSRGSAPGL